MRVKLNILTLNKSFFPLKLSLPLFLFALIVFPQQGNSRDRNIDSLLQYIQRDLINRNPVEALKMTNDLLVLNHLSNEHKIETLFIQANILRRNGIRDEAINIMLEADREANKLSEKVWKARINGLIATLYRESNLLNESNKHLDIAVEASKKIRDKNESNKFLGNLSQEKAYKEISNKNYKYAISILEHGSNFFKNIDSTVLDKNFSLATNSELLSKCFFALEQYDLVQIYLSESLMYLERSQQPNSVLKGFIKNGIGYASLKLDNTKQAYEYFIIADSIAEISNFDALKIEVYSSLMEYYTVKDNKEEYNNYNNKLQDIKNQHAEINSNTVNDLLINLYNTQEILQKNYRYKILIVTLISVLILTLTIIFYIRKRRQDREHIQQIIERFKVKEKKPEPNTEKSDFDNTGESDADTEQKVATHSDNEDNIHSIMSEETEALIRKGIDDFIENEEFLSKDVSLNSLASTVGVNQRYLSKYINFHEKKSFSTYINELKIGYIINYLNNKPEALSYKISYLADLCGFSSHSRFSIVFKDVAQVTPVDFINYLIKKRKDE